MKKTLLCTYLLLIFSFNAQVRAQGYSICYVYTYYQAPVCIGGTLRLGSGHYLDRPYVNKGPYVYSWAGPGGFTSNQPNPVITNATPAMGGMYTLTATDTNNCTTSDSVFVVISSPPNVSITQWGLFCPRETIHLSASASGGKEPYSYYWTGPLPEFSAYGQEFQLAHADSTMNGTYTVWATDGNGCSGYTTTVVTLNPLPVVSVSNSGPVCAGETVHLSASGGINYQWRGPQFSMWEPQFMSESPNPSIPDATDLNSGNYTLIAYNEFFCWDTASTEVVVKQIRLGFGTTLACPGESNGSATALPSKVTLYGAGNSYPTFFGSIDPLTGNFSAINDSVGQPYPDLIGIKAMASNTAGEVYALKDYRSLYKIDVAHKTASYIGEVYTCGFLNELAFDSHDVLYGTDNCGTIFTMDLQHVAYNQVPITIVGNTGYESPLTGLRFNPYDGSLWACDQYGLFKLDPTDHYKIINIGYGGQPLYFGSHLSDIVFDGHGIPYVLDCEEGHYGSLLHFNSSYGYWEQISTSLFSVTTLFTYALPLTYLWSNGQTTPTATGLAAGLYSVTVNNIDNCPATDTVRVYENTEVKLTATLLHGTSCNNACDAAITLTPSGGKGTYVFSDAYDFSGAIPLEQDFQMRYKDYTQTNGMLTQDQMQRRSKNAIVTKKQYDANTDLTFEISLTGGYGAERFFGLTNGNGDSKEDYLIAFHKDRNGISAWEKGGQHEEYLGVNDYDYNTLYDYKIEKRGAVIRYLFRIHGTEPYTVLYTNNIDITYYSGTGYVTPQVKAGILSTDDSYYPYFADNLRITYLPQLTGLCPGTYTFRVRDSVGCKDAIASVIVPVNTGSFQLNTSVTGTCANGCNGAVTLTPSGGTAPYTYGFSYPFAGDQLDENLFDFQNGNFSQFGELNETSGYNTGWNNSIAVKQEFDGSDIYFEGSFRINSGLYSVYTSLYVGLFDASLALAPEAIRLGFFIQGGSMMVCGNNTRQYVSSYIQPDSWFDMKVEKHGNLMNFYIRNPLFTEQYQLVYSMVNTVSFSNVKAAVINDDLTNNNFAWYNGYSSKNWLLRCTPKTSGLCPGNYAYTVFDANGCSANTEVAILEDVPFPVTPHVTDADFICNGSVNFTTTSGTIINVKKENFESTFKGNSLDFEKLRVNHGNFSISGGSLNEGLHPNNPNTWDNGVFSRYPIYGEDTLAFEYAANFQFATENIFGLSRYYSVEDPYNPNVDYGIVYTSGQLYAAGGGYWQPIGECTSGEWHDFRIEKTAAVVNYYIRRRQTGNFELLYSLTITNSEIVDFYYVGVADAQSGDPERAGSYATRNWKVYGGSAVTGLCPNLYTYKVTSDNGCADNIDFIVGGQLYLEVNEHVVAPNCFGEQGYVSFDVTGGNPPYQISFDNGANFQPMEGPYQSPYWWFSSGSYTALFKDKGYTYESKTFVITAPPPLPSSFSIIGNTPVCNGDSVVFNADTAGGVTFFEWWLDGQTIPGAFSTSYVATQSGVYKLWSGKGTCASPSEEVTVTFNTPPAFTSCPGNMTVNSSANTSGTPVSFAVALSGKPNPSITYSLTGATQLSGTGSGSGSLFNNGITYVSIKATNNCGTSECNFTVTVEDHTNPFVVTKGLNISLDSSGMAFIVPSQIDNGSTDAGGIASYSLNKTLFSCADTGSNTVTLTVTDNSGNHSSANAVVQVSDDTPPVARVRDLTIQLDVTGHASITPSQVNNGSSDACGIVSITLDKTSFNCSNVGPNMVTLTVKDMNGNSSSANTTVTVNDVTPPVATARNITLNLDATGHASITAAQINNGSSDACGITSINIDKSSFDCANVGPNTVMLTATDTHGNITTAEAIVTVKDITPPVVVTQNITLNLDATGHASITAAQVNKGSSDTCGIASISVDKSSFDCANVGPNTVTLTVTDTHGNTTTAEAIVTIKDVTVPVVVTRNIALNLDATGHASISANQVNNGSSDTCGIASISIDKSSFDCSNVGSNNITLTVTDVNGNVNSASATVNVSDVTSPAVVTKTVTINLDATGNASITPSQVNNGSSDACGIASMTLDKSSFNCSHIGPNRVMLTVNDMNGNSSNADATVTVNDVTPPVVITKSITVTLNDGIATINAFQVNNGSSDACGIKTMSLSQATFTCANIGANQIILTVTDNHGNTSTGYATVTVMGVIPSVSIGLSPANNIYTGGDPSKIFLGYGSQSLTLTAATSGSGPYTYKWSGATSISNTTGSSTVFTPSTTGTYYIKVIATDNNGCIASSIINSCVIDIRSGNGKVYLCHAPPGNSDNRQNLSISTNAVPAHLNGHPDDKLGTCSAICGYGKTASSAGTIYTEGEINLIVHPNPSQDVFLFKLESTNMEEVHVRIYDMIGKLILEETGLSNEDIMVRAGYFANGVYNAVVSQGDFERAIKIVKVF